MLLSSVFVKLYNYCYKYYIHTTFYIFGCVSGGVLAGKLYFLIFLITSILFILTIELKRLPREALYKYSMANVERNGSCVSSNNPSQNMMEKRFPSAIVIGAGKAGTGTLIKMLRLHPSVVSRSGELNYFQRHYDKGYEWYRQQMPASRSDQVTIVKTANYLYKKNTPDRILLFNKAVKLMVILKEPVNRTLSWYAQYLSMYDEKKSFEDIVLLPDSDVVDANSPPIRTGCYSRSLPMWLSKFNRSQILFIDGDVFIDDPYIELHKIELFLNVSSYFSREMFVFDEDKEFYCPVVDGHPECMSPSKGRQHITISHKLRLKLINYFQPCNANLTQLTGQQFSWI